LSGVIGFLFLLFISLLHPFFHDLIFVNAPYVLTIACISLVPVLIVKRLKWYPEAAPRLAWVLLFLTTGFYYAINRGPNIIGLILDIVTARSPENTISTLSGIILMSGVFALFYFLMAFIAGQKDDVFSLKVDIKSYCIWALAYLVYLNTLVSIVNPVFRRPF
jgi:hypothetical protein